MICKLIGLLFCVIVFSPSANAALFDRGHGLIYDSVLNVTWMQDFNYAKTSGHTPDGRLLWLEGAEVWVQDLNFGGFNDWRLPTIYVEDNTWSYSGTDYGYNGSTHNNELAHLWYETLGNTSAYDENGNEQDTIVNASFFINIAPNYYFLSDGNSLIYPNRSGWVFDMNIGAEGLGSAGFGYAVAVRGGDITTVPTPSALMLIVLGLFGVFRCRKATYLMHLH